jgi:hypothetical protein
LNHLFKFTEYQLSSLFEGDLNEDTDLEYKVNGPILWDAETKTFSVEASDVRIGSPEKEVTLKFQGKTIKFKQTKVDKDGSGEDIYGWNYDSVEGAKFPCKLLIIND